MGRADAVRVCSITSSICPAARQSWFCAPRAPSCLRTARSWGGGKLNASTVLLEPLDCRRMRGAARSAGRWARAGRASAGDRRQRGQPAVSRGDGRARPRTRHSVSPPTIKALLAARLDRLAIEERELLERGAIEGEVFHRSAIRAMAEDRRRARTSWGRGTGAQGVDPAPGRDSAGRRCFPVPSPPDPRRRLRGPTEGDARGAAPTVRRLARGVRRELVELDEIAGWHLEQAVRYQRELKRS